MNDKRWWWYFSSQSRLMTFLRKSSDIWTNSFCTTFGTTFCSLFSLVKNKRERKRKRENKKIMWVWGRKLYKSCIKMVVFPWENNCRIDVLSVNFHSFQSFVYWIENDLYRKYNMFREKANNNFRIRVDGFGGKLLICNCKRH